LDAATRYIPLHHPLGIQFTVDRFARRRNMGFRAACVPISFFALILLPCEWLMLWSMDICPIDPNANCINRISIPKLA
jgi:hypothetical protein